VLFVSRLKMDDWKNLLVDSSNCINLF